MTSSKADKAMQSQGRLQCHRKHDGRERRKKKNENDYGKKGNLLGLKTVGNKFKCYVETHKMA
jgi:hypothetical protein